jgi:hypothetical protein
VGGSVGGSEGGSVGGSQGNKWRSKRKFGAGKSASQPSDTGRSDWEENTVHCMPAPSLMCCNVQHFDVLYTLHSDMLFFTLMRCTALHCQCSSGYVRTVLYCTYLLCAGRTALHINSTACLYCTVHIFIDQRRWISQPYFHCEMHRNGTTVA